MQLNLNTQIINNQQNLTYMKTIVKAAMLFASAMMLFSSCLKEQTGLSVEDIPGVAKISGKLMINEGQAYEGGKFVELLKPAGNY